jgi:hypothetical protein
MRAGVAVGLLAAFVILAILIFISSAHVQRLKSEGQFGYVVSTS